MKILNCITREKDFVDKACYISENGTMFTKRYDLIVLDAKELGKWYLDYRTPRAYMSPQIGEEIQLYKKPAGVRKFSEKLEPWEVVEIEENTPNILSQVKTYGEDIVATKNMQSARSGMAFVSIL